MDYDDNDTQTNNLELAGESASKSSSLLRPYAFPRFDFDENLPGHLRFDSLVETEAYLGIQGQEDNHWIEDYSRGNSVIEFSSSATDSCSISRRHNVWSEATSSESVEMLLKSVGQEQLVPSESIIDSSATCNELDRLAKQMEAIRDKDNRSSGYSRAPDDMLPSHELLSNIPVPKDIIEGEMSPNQGTSIPETSLLPVCDDPGHLGPNVSEEKFEAAATKNNLLAENEYVDSRKEDQCLEDESLNCQNEEKSDPVGSSHDTETSLVTLCSESQQKVRDPDLDCPGGLSRGVDDAMLLPSSGLSRGVDDSMNMLLPSSVESDVQTSDVQTSDVQTSDIQTSDIQTLKQSAGNSVCSGSKVDAGNFDEAIPSLCTDSAARASIEALEFQSQKESGNDASCISPSQPEAGEVNILRTGAMVIVANDISSGTAEQHDTEMGTATKGLCSSTEQHGDSVRHLEQGVSNEKLGNLAENIREKDDENTGRIYEISPDGEEAVRPLEDKFGGSSSIYVDKLSNLPSTSSVDPKKEEDVISRGNNKSEASVLEKVEPGSPNVSRVVSVSKEDPISLSVNISCTTATSEMVYQGSEPSILVGNMTVDRNLVDQGLPLTTAKMDSDCGAPFHEKDNSHVDASKIDADPESSGADVSELDSNTSKISVDVSLSTMGRIDQVLTEIDKATGVGSVHHAVSQPPIFDSSAKSPPVVKEIESGATENKLSEDGVKKYGLDPNQCDKSPNPTGSGDANPANNHEDRLKADKGEAESSLDSLEVACGSPSIINSGNPSHNEGGSELETMGSAVANEIAQADQCSSRGKKLKDTIEDDNSFTFKVNSVPESVEGGKGNNWTPLSKVETFSAHTVVEQTVVQKAGIENTDADVPHQTISPGPVAQLACLEVKQATLPQETPNQISKASAGGLVGEVSKGGSGRRGRRASGKGTTKDASSRLNSQNVTTPVRSCHKGEKSPCVSPSISGVTLPASIVSASPPNLAFSQPFTDAQQVQLRAQIFVYGSLIQGSAPEEGYMVSAFGPTDVARRMWDSAWRAFVERVRNQKSHLSLETPVRSTGARSSEAVSKQGSHQANILPSTTDRGGSKDSSTPILNPMIPLSSPLWGLPTPHSSSQSRGMQRGTILDFQPGISPLHPYQTPSNQGLHGNTAWPSQASFSPNPWVSQKSALNTSACFTPVSLTEPVKLSCVKDSSLPPSSEIQNVSTNPTPFLGNPSLVFAGFPSSYPSQTMGVSSPPPSSAEPKLRKRKKSQASSDISQSPAISQGQPQPQPQPQPQSQSQSQPQTQPQPQPVATSPTVVSTPSPVTGTLPAAHVPPCSAVASLLSSVSPISATSQPKVGGPDPRTCTAYSEETLRKVSEAKLQAEEAASLAASALSHSESVWSALSNENQLATSSEAEARISSAAVAVAAAASVARAAAAAARVASNAAFQAKLMAEEALLPYRSENCSSESQNMREGEPGSAIVAAREAAKKRKEVATAAAKQAENLEAIVKAAELAEQAVSQAGRIVSMGDPLPLKDLIAAGPEGHWKLRQPPAEQVIESDKKNSDQMKVSALETERGSSVVRVQESSDHEVRVADMSSGSLDNHAIAGDIPQSIGGVEPVPRTDSGPGAAQRDHEDLDLLGTSICKGSSVEVYKHDGGLKPAWFSANVLALEDGKALVSYCSLLTDGSKNLQEWVALEGEENEAPRIRSAPESALDTLASKKRRRTAMADDYTWSVGDRVDVQFQDCWWEGRVTEKSEKDETTLTVHFPARGETSAVRSWQLRPSRCWSDGKWVEWCRLRGQDHERDVPLGKRQKFGSPYEVSKKVEKVPKVSETNVERSEPKRTEKLPKVSETNLRKPQPTTSSLALSASEKVFNVGKNSSKPDMRRPLRTGMQKEGSKVVIGVPKPGKKRKFMEVNSSGNSNVPAGDRNEKRKGSEPAKFTKYLVPQAAAAPSRGGKVYSRGAAPRPAAASSRKPPNTTTTTTTSHRTASSRGEKRSKPETAVKLDNFTDPRIDDDDDDSDDNVSEKLSSMDQGSSGTEEVNEGPLSSLFPNQLEKLSSKVGKGKLGPGTSAGKFTRHGEDNRVVVFNAKADKSSAADEAEQPRRSGRRIQPTHRLLEGLQSSLIMPKTSSLSHDRSHKLPKTPMPKTPKWK